MAVSVLLIILSMIWLALSSELWMLYMFAAIYGLSFGGLSTMMAGLIYDVSNEYFIAFIFGAAAMLLVALIVPLIKRKEMVQ